MYYYFWWFFHNNINIICWLNRLSFRWLCYFYNRLWQPYDSNFWYLLSNDINLLVSTDSIFFFNMDNPSHDISFVVNMLLRQLLLDLLDLRWIRSFYLRGFFLLDWLLNSWLWSNWRNELVDPLIALSPFRFLLHLNFLLLLLLLWVDLLQLLNVFLKEEGSVVKLHWTSLTKPWLIGSEIGCNHLRWNVSPHWHIGHWRWSKSIGIGYKGVIWILLRLLITWSEHSLLGLVKSHLLLLTHVKLLLLLVIWWLHQRSTY